MIYHEERLNDVNWRLAGFIRGLAERLAIHGLDILIMCGWRGEADQHKAFIDGKSKVDWPNGKHNTVGDDGSPCSDAVDVSPYPYDAGRDRNRLYLIAGYAVRLAEETGFPLRIGADWDGDLQTLDQTLPDPWHYELVIK